VLRDAKRIVVKVGSSLVTNEGRGLDEVAIGEWCRQMAHLMREGARSHHGLQRCHRRRHEAPGLDGAPHAIQELQAAAGGQMGLAQMYETKLRNGLGQRPGAADPRRSGRP
jgi:glutamate 5-kinase